jgi:hypothetical protein
MIRADIEQDRELDVKSVVGVSSVSSASAEMNAQTSVSTRTCVTFSG